MEEGLRGAYAPLPLEDMRRLADSYLTSVKERAEQSAGRRSVLGCPMLEGEAASRDRTRGR